MIFSSLIDHVNNTWSHIKCLCVESTRQHRIECTPSQLTQVIIWQQKYISYSLKKSLKRLTTTSLSQTWTLRYISKKGLSLVQVISGIKYRLSGDKGFILFYCLLNSSLNLFNFVENHIFKCLIAYRTLTYSRLPQRKLPRQTAYRISAPRRLLNFHDFRCGAC